MKNKIQAIFVSFGIYGAAIYPSLAQETAFTYQGELRRIAGQPVTGLYDFTFQLFDATSAGTSYGGIVSAADVGVTNGLFTVVLDFGSQFPGANRWLEISVRTNGASVFSTLAPRQELTPMPYAIFAENVGSGGLAGGTYGNALTLNNSGNSFTGNGSGLTSLNASQLSAGTVPIAALANAWTLTGNSGTASGVNFIGTADNIPLDLRAHNTRGLELRDGFRSTGTGSGVEGMNVLGGSYFNYADAGVIGATIAGGGYSYGPFTATTYVSNSVYSDLGAIGGGSGNTINPNSANTVIAGGIMNTIGNNSFNSNAVVSGGYRNEVDSFSSAIGGGSGNNIGINSPGSVVAGGNYNADWNGSTNSVISGGYGNQVYAMTSVIGGGYQNVIGSGGQYNFIGGGSGNTVQASSTAVIVAGGIGNYAGPDGQGTSYASAVGGGHNNNADGDYSTVPGGDSNWAPGAYSFAAGRRAKATLPGQFVWADSQNSDFAPSYYHYGFTNDSFCARVQGGVLFTSGTQSVYWNPANGGWGYASDRNVKDRFSPVNPEAVLDKVTQLPTTEWSYIGYSQRHIGPMAQDFHALFPLNDNDKVLNEVDLHGVELTAIKGLNLKLERENADLRRQLDALKQIVESLDQKINKGSQ